MSYILRLTKTIDSQVYFESYKFTHPSEWQSDHRVTPRGKMMLDTLASVPHCRCLAYGKSGAPMFECQVDRSDDIADRTMSAAEAVARAASEGESWRSEG